MDRNQFVTLAKLTRSPTLQTSAWNKLADDATNASYSYSDVGTPDVSSDQTIACHAQAYCKLSGVRRREFHVSGVRAIVIESLCGRCLEYMYVHIYCWRRERGD